VSKAKDGDKVKVHYTGKLKDGTVFDSSEGRPPLEFTLGQGKIIPGFEKGVMGMGPGDKKTITVPPGDGYGESRDELIVKVNKSHFPENIDPSVGKQLQVTQSDGNVVEVTVTEMEGDSVTLDANHPLAGKTLVFDVELVEIA
jgi:peptidylprolyl isomerase